jgi:hypothetical protein
MSLSILVVVCQFNSFTFCGLCFSSTRECVDEPEKKSKKAPSKQMLFAEQRSEPLLRFMATLPREILM